MLTMILLYLLSQEPVEIAPITAGNRIPNGSYLITVPDNCLFVDEEHVLPMYSTLGVANIPNCVGLFISESQAYTVIVQHYPYQAFKLEPVIEDHEFNTLHSYTHLYKKVPYSGDAEVFVPPTIDEQAGSFAFGMHYYNTEANAGYFVKKIWVTGQDALVLSVTSSEEGYLAHQTEIESILQSVTRNENAERLEPMGEPVSYLDLLGMYLKEPTVPQEAQVDGLPSSIIFSSIGLAVGAVLLLILAARVQKKNKKVIRTEPDAVQT